VREAIHAALVRLTPKDGRAAVTGSAAAGADTIVLEVASELALPAFVVLPFDRSAFSEGFTADEWLRTERLIDAAADVESVASSADREAGYLETGIRTVDRADVVIAVWDGEPARGPAGTASIVAYARALGKPLIVINPTTGASASERMPSLDPPDSGAGHRRGSSVIGGHAAVAARFSEADSRARQLSPAAHWLVLWIIVLHLLATAVAVASVSFHWTDWLSMASSFVKLSLLLAAIWLAWRHRRAHHVAMQNRMEAELCRSALALWPMTRDAAMLPRVPVPGFETVQRDLRLTWLVDQKGVLQLGDAKRAYLARIVEQRDYFTRHHARALTQYNVLRVLALVSTLAAIACIALSAGLSAAGSEGELYVAAKFLSIVLPLANAAALSTVLALDLGRRVERYRTMASDVEAVRGRVEHAATWPTLWRAARDGEEILLFEAAEWLAVTRFAGDRH
jgi:hypothetical protein